MVHRQDINTDTYEGDNRRASRGDTVPRWIFTLCIAIIFSVSGWGFAEFTFISDIKTKMALNAKDIELLNGKLSTHEIETAKTNEWISKLIDKIPDAK
jgi:hypothetical protein